MCNPAAFFMGMAMAGGQLLKAEQQRDIAQERQAQAYEAAVAQRNLQEKQIAQTLSEAQAQAKLDKLAISREASKQRGQIAASASEAGVFGNALLSQLAESMVQESENEGVIDFNYANTVNRARLQGEAFDLNAMNTINANKAPRTNPFLTGLQIGTSALRGGMEGYKMGTDLEDITGGD